MARRSESDLRVGGLSVAARFTLFMTLALTPVLVLSGYLLYDKAADIAEGVLDETLAEGVKIRAEEEEYMSDFTVARSLYELANREYQDLREEHANRLRLVSGAEKTALQERLKAIEETEYAEVRRLFDEVQAIKSKLPDFWIQREEDRTVRSFGDGLRSLQVSYGPKKDRYGIAYQYQHGLDRRTSLVVPDQTDVAGRGILGLILGITLVVILVAAGVAAWVGSQVSQPLQKIVGDIRQIASGNLSHRTHVRAGGEIALLARAINRMGEELSEAQDTELELQMREREVEVANEVREALLAESVPKIEDGDLGVMHLASEEMSGDFHDFVELGGGQVGLLVCDVSGQGVPGTLVGATARAYLRTELGRGGDVRTALLGVNRLLAQDVRSGMYVTALYVVVDARGGTASVVCAGHKIPLIRYTASDKRLRLVQPEGIALGFDRGPIFDRALQVQEIPFEPGDRLVLTNTGAVEIASPAGTELGEKEFYARIARFGDRPSAEFLERMQTVLESYADGTPLPRDVSVVTIQRAPA